MLQLTFRQEHMAHFSHLGLNKNCSTCKRVLVWKSWWSCVVRHNPHHPKILKNAIVFDITLYSIWSFSATPGLTSSINCWIGNFAPAEEDSIEIPLIWILVSKSWLSKVSRKLLLKWIHLEMVFLRNYSFDFIHHCHNQQPYSFIKGFLFNFYSPGFLHQSPATPRNREFLCDSCRNSIS